MDLKALARECVGNFLPMKAVDAFAGLEPGQDPGFYRDAYADDVIPIARLIKAILDDSAGDPA